MSDAFEAELNNLHAAADADFGVAATFRPASGQPVACVVEKMAPQQEIGSGHAKMSAPAVVLMVQVATLGRRPVKDDKFEETTSGLSWRVIASASIEDDDGRRYTVKVEKA